MIMKTMKLKTLYLKKRFPLKISRGTFFGSENLFVMISENNNVGFGEMCPGTSEGAETAQVGKENLEDFMKEVELLQNKIIF